MLRGSGSRVCAAHVGLAECGSNVYGAMLFGSAAVAVKAKEGGEMGLEWVVAAKVYGRFWRKTVVVWHGGGGMATGRNL